jgi:2-polyprenyl-6-methoxyphenol hydroxylase-like FAD-dependent oxidoreductase
MRTYTTDIAIIGAGPVGLMCGYLAEKCGLKSVIIDKSDGPLQVGRADALNARTLQLLESVGLFDELYALGKPCNTSSVWANGAYISRQSSWWDELEGCFHKHFLMLGQAYLERLVDQKLSDAGNPVLRSTSILDVKVLDDHCETSLSNHDKIISKYVIGSDGSRSKVRQFFSIPFEITKPQMTWAVLDCVIETDFQKVPEIIVFQTDTSDVAWIPRERNIERFYVRMDRETFTLDDVLAKIRRAVSPHFLKIIDIEWYSQFSVKESVAEHFSSQHRVFLAGDACHIHSVNGGQGLNTGMGDAFNLIWKLNMVENHGGTLDLLNSYESERKLVARSVIESSGELVRSTKYSSHGTHALDYVGLVQKRSGNITGMGIRYGESGLVGTRLFDFELFDGQTATRIYSHLDYSKFTLLNFGDEVLDFKVPSYVTVIQVFTQPGMGQFWSKSLTYRDRVILVRPDSYIAAVDTGDERTKIQRYINDI